MKKFIALGIAVAALAVAGCGGGSGSEGSSDSQTNADYLVGQDPTLLRDVCNGDSYDLVYTSYQVSNGLQNYLDQATWDDLLSRC